MPTSLVDFVGFFFNNRCRSKEKYTWRLFGDVWLGWLLWQALELDTFCESIFAHGREKVSWSHMVLILVLARLCEPSSELHIAEDWYRRIALEDLLGIKPEAV